MDGFNNFGKIADALPGLMDQVTRKTAFDLKANVQAKIRSNHQIDTGFMMGSVYVVTNKDSTYAGGANALPEISRPSEDATARVAMAAKYSAAQNYGTTRIPARPFWEPSVEKTRVSFNRAMAAVAKKLEEGTQ